ncbi:hypothetical protein FWC63_02005 [Candidatus Saccharibacteria bacterium]|nr:hypothetical protein [Candidatus Saccharibacteria bacterium]
MIGVISNSVAGPVRAMDATQAPTARGGNSISVTILNTAACSNFDVANGNLGISLMLGGIAAACMSVAVSTDAEDGYTVHINGPDDGNLTMDYYHYITPSGGTMLAPRALAPYETGGVWGFAIPNGQISGFSFGFDTTYSESVSRTSRFANVPRVPTAFSTTDNVNSSPNTYNIFFAVAASNAIVAGAYSGEIVISASINQAPPPPVLVMQEITNANCPTERRMAVDNRDGRTYWVQMMADGNCWMLTNLAYGGGGDNTFGDAVDWLVLADHGSFIQPQFSRPPGANPTAYPEEPSVATDGGSSNATRQFGYLYNWCAAMGNQQDTAACLGTSTPAHNPNISICPAGWRLPTGESGTGELTQLNNAVNNGATDTSAGLMTYWLGMRGGYWRASVGEFTSVGSWGAYWSSTTGNSSARDLFFSNSRVSLSNSYNKQTGMAVRCVAM